MAAHPTKQNNKQTKIKLLEVLLHPRIGNIWLLLFKSVKVCPMEVQFKLGY